MLQRLKHFARDQRWVRAGALRATALLRSLERAGPGIYTLCYHHVTPAAQARFSAQIAHLKRFGPFIDLDTAVARIGSGAARQTRAFVLSFDDGYRDTLEVALPVLQDHGVPATLFLVSDWIDGPPLPKGYMNRADVEAWLTAGHDIGSHSASHRRFSQLSDDQCRRELAGSATVLRDLRGAPVRHFACPWGVAVDDYLPERDPILAYEAGYATFFTTRRGSAQTDADLLAMPRHVLEPEWPVHELDALLGGSRLAGT